MDAVKGDGPLNGQEINKFGAIGKPRANKHLLSQTQYRQRKHSEDHSASSNTAKDDLPMAGEYH
jgi:hypothetical protein